jgi:transposase
MGQVSVISGAERRRSWSEERKLELLAEAFGPGGNVADAARRADICTSLLYRWRQAIKPQPGPSAFVPVVVREDGDAPATPAITIVLAGGATVTVGAQASPALVKAVLGALR